MRATSIIIEWTHLIWIIAYRFLLETVLKDKEYLISCYMIFLYMLNKKVKLYTNIRRKAHNYNKFVMKVFIIYFYFFFQIKEDQSLIM